MSFTAARESSRKHNCQSCRERKARFRLRGRVKADHDHTLCFECFRSTRDRRRAESLKVIAPLRPLERPSPAARSRTANAVAHRQRMLVHLVSMGR
jgi:hypothetical protein